MKIDTIKTVNDLLKAKNLSPEELELHKELIAECMERERQIEACRLATENNLNRLSLSLETFSRKTSALGQALEGLLSQADDLYLRLLPQDKFFHE